MNFRKLLFAFCITVNTAFSQSIQEYGNNSINIKEDGKTIKFDVYPVHSKIKISTQKKYYWYSANELHNTQGGYSGKLLNGDYKEFYNNKNLKESGQYHNGLKNGPWKRWTEPGLLDQVITWKDGVKDGKFILYDSTGTIGQTGRYKNDRLNGNIITYVSKDSTSRIIYKNGVIIPPKKSFFNRINIFRKKRQPGSN